MTKSNSMSAGILRFKSFVFLLLLLPGLCSVYAQAGIKVESIDITGNHFFSSQVLHNLLKSKKGKHFNSRLMRLDKILLANFYALNGFLDVFVSTEFQRVGNKIRLHYSIREGRRYYLRQIQFSGNKIIGAAELRKRFKIADLTPYNQPAIDDGLNLIENYYFNHGKPYARISAKRKVENDSLILLQVQITEDATVKIEDVSIEGLTITRPFVILRELTFHKGDQYSRKKIQESNRNIYNVGLFDFVDMNLVPLDSLRSRVKVVIRVNERKPRWLGARFGVSNDPDIVYGGTLDFTLEGGHRNLLGTGRSIALSVIPSFIYEFRQKRLIRRKSQYSFTYVEPWVAFTRTPGVLQLSFLQIRPTFSQKFNLFNSSFKLSHRYSDSWSAGATIFFQRIRTLETSNLDSLDHIYGVTFDQTRDKRDNFLNPQHGSLLEFNEKLVYSSTRDILSGQTQVNRFIRVMAQWNRYQPFAFNKKWTLASRLRTGAILKLGALTRIPVLDRFYLGGATSVRGFKEQLLGPVDYSDPKNPRALGGRLLVLANVELRIPLFWLLYGEFFNDVGNVWSRISDFQPFSLRGGSGIGAAILTPLGAFRFDYGLKWKPRQFEKRGEFHIGISFAF